MFSIVLPIILSVSNWPYQANFQIKYFNNSICSNHSNRHTDISLFCTDTQKINGTVKCCKNVLDEFEIINNSRFNTCYNFLPNQSMEYDCTPDSISNMNGQQIWATIGIFFAGLLSIIIVIFFFVNLRKYFINSLNYQSL